MELTKYGATLSQLTNDKIELVRNWRNDSKISQYMEFKDYITPEMQERWFDKINNLNNFFFLICFSGKEVGLINIKEIDYIRKTGEAGIFIYDEDFLGGTYAFQATLCLYDFFFEDLQMQKLYAHILKTNRRAVLFNKYIGFKLIEKDILSNNQLYQLTKEDYLLNRDRITSVINI